MREAVEKLGRAKDLVDESKDVIERCKDEEEEAYDNLPESLQYGAAGDSMQDHIDVMDEALSELDTAGETISEQIDAINGMFEK